MPGWSAHPATTGMPAGSPSASAAAGRSAPTTSAEAATGGR
ncbi:MAG: hypothetical protein M5R40_03105 [Anaerolineae bacterium]|nr:hypothetical protein [Anaerolineae bacterium]